MIALENLEGLIMLPKSPKYFEVQLHAVYSCFVIQNYSEKKNTIEIFQERREQRITSSVSLVLFKYSS